MRKPRSFRELWDRLHHEEDGFVSLETILIIGVIAMPILIFLLKYGWPMIKNYFNNSTDALIKESESSVFGPLPNY